jgi:ATP-dependent helicase/nuclease subunit A
MPKWTEEQSSAIRTRHKNLLISAAAGSGKTAVLIERILGLIIDDEVPIDSFLIVTYTNAAAGEMRERLLKKISEKLKEMPDNTFLKEQIYQLGNAQISTIHSFCITVVRTYFYKLALDPTFKIGDTYDLELLREEALNDVFEKEYFLGQEDFLELVESYSGNREDQALRDMILKIYEFILSKPNPFEWLTSVMDRYDVAEDTNYWLKHYKEDIKAQLLEGRSLLQACLPLCQIEEGPEEYLPAIQSDIAMCQDLIDRLDISLDAYHQGLEVYKSVSLKRVAKARKDIVDVDIQDQVKELRKLYKDKVIKVLQESAVYKDEQGLISEFVVLHKRLKTIYRLVEAFKGQYQLLKLDKNVLDFSDLEHYTIDLLKEEEIRQNLSDQFNYIFVDEYQDANEIQEAIIQGMVKSDNLFMVGDVKQSIYKFRLADPSIFLNKMETYKEGKVNKRIDLSKNFRSRASILEGINEIFKRLMSKTFGEIAYDEAAYLYPGREDAKDKNYPVEIQMITEDKDSDLDESIKGLESIEKEAHYIAKRINGLVQEGYSYDDVVILLRGAKVSGPLMAEVFAGYGIPSYLEAGGEYFEAIEVKILLGLLNVIDNCEQDIPMLTVMRSIFGRFSTDEMAQIRKGDKGVTYYEAMQGYILNHEDPLAEKIRNFLLKIEGWAKSSICEPLQSLIWEIVHNNGFLAFVEALPEGDRRLGNIEALINKVASLESLGGLSLFRLIRILEKIEDFSGDMGGQGGQQQETSSVRIMTIHKSKGLEFPVVFLAGANKAFNLKDAQGNMLLHKDHGMGLKYVDPWRRTTSKSVPQVVIKQRILEENLSEEMRVLYVALTRAVDRLIVTGFTKNIDSLEKKWGIGDDLFNLKRARTYLDWMMMIVRGGHMNTSYFEIGYQSLDAVFEADRLSEVNSNQVISLLENHSISPDTLSWIDHIPRMDAYEEGHVLPAKVSVSSLKRMKIGGYKQQQPLPPLVEKPKFMVDQDTLAPEERGTRIHHLLRHIDYGAAGSFERLMGEIKDLEARGLVSTEGLGDLDYRKILGFIRSKLGRRIMEAKAFKREAPFVFSKKINDTEVLVQGIIDLYFEEADGIVLIDFKTDRITKEEVENRSKGYQHQIDLYAEAIEGITGKPVKERYLYFLEIGLENKL